MNREAWTVAVRAHQRGFTLVELIVVIVIAGILAAVAAGRMVSPDEFAAKSYADQVDSLLRFGQKTAIAQNRDVWVRVGSSGVALCYTSGCTTGNRVIAPGGRNSGTSETSTVCGDASWACEAPGRGMSVSAAVALFYFDPLGKPFALGDYSASSPPTASIFNTLTVTVTHSGRSRSVVVEQETGYVH